MIQRYSFIPVFFCILVGLAWWTNQLKSVDSRNDISAVEKVSFMGGPQRIELVETLDKVVIYQHYYHSVYGHFTKLLNRIGFDVPGSLTDNYDIRVVEATADRLLVTALSEDKGKTKDLISIDQDYQLHANFSLPPPRADYVKMRTMKYLRLVRDAPSGQNVAEEGVFKGYFRYSTTKDSRDEKVVVADGIRPPVMGVHLELNGQYDGGADWNSDTNLISDGDEKGVEYGAQFSRTTVHTGQNDPENTTDENMASLAEEAHLAQKIFRGEMGRYAKTWSELAQIAHFRFEGRDHFDLSEGVPRNDVSSGYNLGKEQEKGSVLEVDRQITSTPSSAPLEIEPVLAGPQ